MSSSGSKHNSNVNRPDNSDFASIPAQYGESESDIKNSTHEFELNINEEDIEVLIEAFYGETGRDNAKKAVQACIMIDFENKRLTRELEEMSERTKHHNEEILRINNKHYGDIEEIKKKYESTMNELINDVNQSVSLSKTKVTEYEEYTILKRQYDELQLNYEDVKAEMSLLIRQTELSKRIKEDQDSQKIENVFHEQRIMIENQREKIERLSEELISMKNQVESSECEMNTKVFNYENKISMINRSLEIINSENDENKNLVERLIDECKRLSLDIMNSQTENSKLRNKLDEISIDTINSQKSLNSGRLNAVDGKKNIFAFNSETGFFQNIFSKYFKNISQKSIIKKNLTVKSQLSNKSSPLPKQDNVVSILKKANLMTSDDAIDSSTNKEKIVHNGKISIPSDYKQNPGHVISELYEQGLIESLSIKLVDSNTNI